MGELTLDLSLPDNQSVGAMLPANVTPNIGFNSWFKSS